MNRDTSNMPMIDFACKKFSINEVIQCSLGLSKAECRLFQFLLYEDEDLTAQQIAERMKIDRTTVQKAIKNLVENDIVLRLQENLDKGGYIFRYRIRDKDVIRKRIKDIVSNWYRTVLTELERW